VRVISFGKSEMAKLSLEITRDKDSKRCDVYLSADRPIDSVAIRLGPFPVATTGLTVQNHSGHSEAELFESGDSKWTWIPVGKLNQSCRIRSQAK
jgi:hypothetical protein